MGKPDKAPALLFPHPDAEIPKEERIQLAVERWKEDSAAAKAANKKRANWDEAGGLKRLQRPANSIYIVKWSFAGIIIDRAIVPIAASALAASVLVYPRQTLHAEAPSSSSSNVQQSQPVSSPPPSSSSAPSKRPSRNLTYPPTNQPTRKPIYSPLPKPGATLLPPQTPKPQQPTILRATPTSYLESSIRTLRLSTQAHLAYLETNLNTLLSDLLTHERTFTSRLASLHPPPSANEALLPGMLYILVATMAGSILARRRNILVRATLPAAMGVGVAWIVVPVTMRNLGELVWEVEERVPVVAESHMRIRGVVDGGWKWAGENGRRLVEWGSGEVGSIREGLEGWIRGGGRK